MLTDVCGVFLKSHREKKTYNCRTSPFSSTSFPIHDSYRFNQCYLIFAAEKSSLNNETFNRSTA
jgi:hypothetical protein